MSKLSPLEKRVKEQELIKLIEENELRLTEHYIKLVAVVCTVGTIILKLTGKI